MFKLKYLKIFLALFLLLGTGVAFNSYSKNKYNSYRYKYTVASTENDDFSEDISFYENRIKRDPKGAFDLATLAELYVARAKLTGNILDFEKADQYAQKSLDNRAAFNKTAILVKADVAQARHEFRKAISIIKLSKFLDPEILSILTTSQLAIGDLKGAFETSTTLTNVNPSPLSFTLRALTNEATGQDNAAENDFKKALSLEEPNQLKESTWIRNMYGRFSMEHGEYSLAEYLFTEALRITSNDPLSYGLLGQLEERKNNYLNAETYYRNAFEASKQVSFLASEARVKRKRGIPEAIELEKQAEILLRDEVYTQKFGHRTELIRLLLENGDQKKIAEAMALINLELEARPNYQSFSLFAQALYKSNKIHEAQMAIQKALATGIHRAEIYNVAALIEEKLNNAKMANKYLEMAKNLE